MFLGLLLSFVRRAPIGWSRAARSGQNQHIIDDLPLLDYGLEIFIYIYILQASVLIQSPITRLLPCHNLTTASLRGILKFAPFDPYSVK